MIDTAPTVGGDAVSGWVYASLDSLTPGAGVPSFVAVPLAAAWLFVARFLARRQRLLSTGDGRSPTVPSPLAAEPR